MNENALNKLILSMLILVSISAIYLSYTSGVLLAYNDATAHLNTARRILDNLTPGIVQIGSVWLPLLHILLIPFAANFFLWQSGLAGSIVSGTSFVVAGYFLFRLLFYLTKNVWGSVIGVLVFASNLNLLYLQTTPMFEPLLIATAMGAIYFLTRWSVEDNYLFLIFAAFFTMLATLTRYDGWALFLAMAVFVLFRGVQRKKSWDGPLLVFLLLAGFGIVMWLLYNYLIFADPLYFSRGEYSAAAQQIVLQSRGQLPTKHNSLLSFITYSLSVVFNIGIPITFTGIVGILSFLKSNIRSLQKYVPLLLLTPYAFNIVSLYFGQSVMWLPMLPPHFQTYFNARYGILMLPAMAFFSGYLSSKGKIFPYIVIIAIVSQLYLFLNPGFLPLFGQKIGLITLQDTVSSVNVQTKSASSFLHTNYHTGLILVSSASSDSFIFRARLPLKNFITEGTGRYWKESLQVPNRFATWIVFFNDHSDRVGKVVSKSPFLPQYFTKVYQDTTYQIWMKKR